MVQFWRLTSGTYISSSCVVFSLFNKLDNLTLMEINTTGPFLTQALDHMYKLRSNLQPGANVESQEFWQRGFREQNDSFQPLPLRRSPASEQNYAVANCDVMFFIAFACGEKNGLLSYHQPGTSASDTEVLVLSLVGEEDTWLPLASRLWPNTLPSAAGLPFKMHQCNYSRLPSFCASLFS